MDHIVYKAILFPGYGIEAILRLIHCWSFDFSAFLFSASRYTPAGGDPIVLKPVTQLDVVYYPEVIALRSHQMRSSNVRQSVAIVLNFNQNSRHGEFTVFGLSIFIGRHPAIYCRR
jgi:hypothetical protein